MLQTGVLESADPSVQVVPLRFKAGAGFHMRHFLGIKHRTERSSFSGGTRLIYTGEPFEQDVPLLRRKHCGGFRQDAGRVLYRRS